MNDQSPVFVVALASEEWPGSSWRLYKVDRHLWHIFRQADESPLTYRAGDKTIVATLSKEFGALSMKSIKPMLWASDVQEMLKLFPYCD